MSCGRGTGQRGEQFPAVGLQEAFQEPDGDVRTVADLLIERLLPDYMGAR
jgi:hypothetical protein